jgi:hypothetical protein
MVDRFVSPVVGKAAGIVTARTMLVAVVPTGTFWLAAFALIATQLGWSLVRGWFDHLDVVHRIIVAAAAAAVVALCAAMLSAVERKVVTLYEGYWNLRWLRRLKAVAEERQKERRKKDTSANRHRLFPDESSVMPTALGNILRASEAYPNGDKRYRLNGVLWWPRFFLVIPESMRRDLSSARASMTLRLHMSVLSTLFVAFTALSAAAFVITRTPASWLLWSIAALAAAAMARLVYLQALGPALIYADLIRSTFDLYRGDVLNRMGYALPETLEKERVLWLALTKLLSRGGADDVEDTALDDARKLYVSKPAK